MSDALIGKTLGQFEIRDVIGRGGMATVYRAHQKTMKRDVAVKVMKREISEDEEFIQRFEREAEIFAVLQHPHILPVIDFGRSDEGWIYIVFRLVEGGGLDSQIRKKGSIEVAPAAKMLSQIGSALTFAHEKHIIHRDLKSNNILLDNRDNAYLTDFGIAKMLASTTRLTSTDHIMGTPSYMAPEQWRGETIDARTDIYALGVIAYEMLSGTLPYMADTPFTLMYKHMNETPPPLSALPKKIPEAVEAVISRAMAKLPEDRFQSADDFAKAFHAAATREEFPAAVEIKRPVTHETPLVQIKFDEIAPSEEGKTISVDSQQLLVEYQKADTGSVKASDTVKSAENRTGFLDRKSRNLALPIGVVVILLIAFAAIFVLTQDDDDGDNKSAAAPPTETATIIPSDTPEPTNAPTQPPQQGPMELTEYFFDDRGLTIIVPDNWDVTEHPDVIDVFPRTDRVTIERPLQIRRITPEMMDDVPFELDPRQPLQDNAQAILTAILEGEPEDITVQNGEQFEPNYSTIALSGVHNREFGRVIIIQVGTDLIVINYVAPRAVAVTQVDEAILLPVIYGLRIDGVHYAGVRGPGSGPPGQGEPNQGQVPPGQPPGSPPPTRPQ